MESGRDEETGVDVREDRRDEEDKEKPLKMNFRGFSKTVG